MSLAPEDYTPSTRERIGVFRRLSSRASGKPSTLLSAGMEVDLGNDTAMQAILRTRQEWQSQVWDAYDACGEVHNAVNAVADLMSRITLFAAEEPEKLNSEPKRTDNAKANDTLKKLGTTVEISQLLHDMAMHKLLPGEFNLVGVAGGDDRPNKTQQEWYVLSRDEIKVEGKNAIIDHPSGRQITLSNTRGDTWIRIWTQHPKKRSLADSPLRPLLGNIDELIWWDAAAIAAAQSRAALAGFIGVPTNLEAPEAQDDPPGLSGNARFVKRLFDNIRRAIQNPRSPSAAAPFIYTYPWNDSGKSGLDVTELQRPQDELLEKRTDRSLRRVAQGFPLPVEAFFGLGEATHWGAGQIEKSKFTEIVEPFVIDLVNDLTRHWFRPILRKLGVDAEKYLIWYDASNLIVQPNLEEQANKGYEYGLVSGQTWRKVNTFSEDDAPTDEEKATTLDWIRALRGREGNAANQDPTNPDANQTDQPREPTPGASHPPKPQPAVVSKGKGQPIAASLNGHTNGHSSLGHRLAAIDADLMSRLQVMCSEQTRQALVKAGNFLSNRAKKNPTLRASLRNVAPEDVAATLGRQAVTTLGTDGMLDGTFTEVPVRFASWCDKAIGAAIESANLPATVVSSATFQLGYSTDDAAVQLVRDLKELTASLIFARNSEDSPQPESDDLLVPASIIRRALARVGNASANGHTNLLLATGRTFNSHLAEAGHFCSGHQWIYPPTPRHSFKRHQSLDGQVFRVDDSTTQPGEVEHCICVAAPIFEEN